jgi:hypothetical protein
MYPGPKKALLFFPHGLHYFESSVRVAKGKKGAGPSSDRCATRAAGKPEPRAFRKLGSGSGCSGSWLGSWTPPPYPHTHTHPTPSPSPPAQHPGQRSSDYLPPVPCNKPRGLGRVPPGTRLDSQARPPPLTEILRASSSLPCLFCLPPSRRLSKR